MATPIVQSGATVMCPHGGTVQFTPSQTRAMANGPILVATDVGTVSGCPFQIPIGTGTKPSPCITVEWSAEATRVKAGGTGVLLQSSVGLCKNAEQTPQGSAQIASTQARAGGT